MPTQTAAQKLAKLREPFPVEKVKQRQGGGGRMLDYVPIETVLERLLELAPDYSWSAHLVHFADNTAVVEGHLTIGDKTAYGIGSMTNRDADMAVKSANSEAMKNAAKNGFGVALELWDQDHLAQLEVARQVGATGSAQAGATLTVVPDDELTQLKNRVADIAVAAGVDRTGPAIAAHFGIPIEKLQDRETLEQIIGQSVVAI